MTTVIVQPDSAGAWIGLAGVALGALLGIGGTWLQRHWAEGDKRRGEVGVAADDLRTAAQALMLLVDAYSQSKAKESLVEWVPLISNELGRVQRATEIIIRYSTPTLGDLAKAVAEQVIVYSSESQSSKRDATKVIEAIRAFTVEARKARI